MAAANNDQSSAALVIVVLFVVGALVIGLAGLPAPTKPGVRAPVSNHAVEKHGADALTAARYLTEVDRLPDCPDKRIRYVKYLGGSSWAIQVTTPGGVPVTSFIAHDDWRVCATVSYCDQLWYMHFPELVQFNHCGGGIPYTDKEDSKE